MRKSLRHAFVNVQARFDEDCNIPLYDQATARQRRAIENRVAPLLRDPADRQVWKTFAKDAEARRKKARDALGQHSDMIEAVNDGLRMFERAMKDDSRDNHGVLDRNVYVHYEQNRLGI